MGKRNAVAIAQDAERVMRYGMAQYGRNVSPTGSAQARAMLESATREWLKADKRNRPTNEQRRNARARRAFRSSGNQSLQPGQTLWSGHGIAATGVTVHGSGPSTRA